MTVRSAAHAGSGGRADRSFSGMAGIGNVMFLNIDGIDVPKKLRYHLCFDDGRKFFYVRPENLIPLGETAWPEDVKDDVAAIFKEIGIEEPLRQKLVEPFAAAFGGIKDSSGGYMLDKVDWGRATDYFRWEAQAISMEKDNDEFDIKAKEMQEAAKRKYGSIFLRYLVYAGPGR
jgi:hypothetical protein